MRKIFTILNQNKYLVLMGQAIFSGGTFLLTFLLARIISINDFGAFSSLILYIYLLISILGALIIQPFQVLIGNYDHNRNYNTFIFIGTCIIISLFIPVSLLLLKLNIPFILPFKNYEFSAITLIVCMLFYDYYRKIFIGEEELHTALFLDTLLTFTQAGIFGYFFLSDKNLPLKEALFWINVSYVPVLVISLYLNKLEISNTSKWKEYYKKHINQGIWLLLTAVIQWWSNNLFVVASGLYLGAAALGAFRLVQSLFGVLNIFLQTFENYVLPSASKLYAVSEEKSKKYLHNISLKGSFIFGGFLLVLFFFSKEIMVLVAGEKYTNYSFLIKGMSILYFIIFIAYPTRIAIRMTNLTNIFFYGYIISFIFSIISFEYLLQEWQLQGTIIGLIVNQLILFLFWQYTLLKKGFNLWK